MKTNQSNHSSNINEMMAVGEAVLLGFTVIVFIFWCLQWYIHIIAIIYGKWRLHRKVQQSSEAPYPGVSIIKPLTGIDKNLYENLETYFTMHYPKYELLFCVEEESDPAIMVVRSLLEKYPTADAKLFIGAKRVGINPKINNMIQGYEAAVYDHILISDCCVKMKEDTLQDIAITMTEKVGLVYQMPYCCDKEGFCGILEKVHFGTQLGKHILNSDLFGINGVTGMSCLFRKEILTNSGGLASLAQFLPEDFYLGQKCLASGYKIRISSQPVWQNSGFSSIHSHQCRMIRWIRLRSSVIPLLILLEPLSECLLLGVVAAWSVTVLFHWSALAFFFVHVLIWFILDYILLQTIQNGPLPCSKFELVIVWLYRELMAPCLLLRAHSSPKLVWRTRVFKIYWGGVGEEVRLKCVL